MQIHRRDAPAISHKPLGQRIFILPEEQSTERKTRILFQDAGSKVRCLFSPLAG